MDNWHISRRTMLKGLGVALSLPFLEAMIPPTLYGIDAKYIPRNIPIRFGFLFMPNGVNINQWDIKGTTLDTLSPILSPLEKVKSEILVMSELWNPKSNQGDGHYFKDAALLTSMTINKTAGSNVSAGGISIDQLIAKYIGNHTKLPSIELGIEPTAKGVDGAVNITRTYANYISWSDKNTPMPCEINPKAAFDRLFRTKIEESNVPIPLTIDDISVLDTVMSDIMDLKGKLGSNDQRKLDEYLTSVRDVEKRLLQNAKDQKTQRKIDPLALKSLPILEQQIKIDELNKGIDHTSHVRLMLDVMLLAFWTDVTRISTFMFGNSVSGRNFSFLEGVKGGHHDMSHHDNNADKLQQYALIAKWHIEQYNYLIEKMSQIKEANGTLLDNSMIMFGSGFKDGNSHNPHNLPLILAGKGGGTINTGRHVTFKKDTPLSNLYGDIAARMGVQIDQFADSTGPLKELFN